MTRPERFAAELTERLATIASDRERLTFLRRIANNWERKYDLWKARIECGREEVTADGPTAFDFVETISIIHIEISRLKKVPA